MTINSNLGLMLRTVAIVFALLPIAMMLSCNQQENSVRSKPEPAQSRTAKDTKPETAIKHFPSPLPDGPTTIIVYYFHRTVRCQTCLDIERCARETIFETFPSEMMEGKLEWRSVNYEVHENAHYSTDFDLPSPSLVLVCEQAGYRREHKVLADVWDLVKDQDSLRDYIKGEVGQLLWDSTD